MTKQVGKIQSTEKSFKSLHNSLSSSSKQTPSNFPQIDMDYKDLGIFIRQERKARKLNQQAFSGMAGISERSLRSIEQGEQTHINTLRKVVAVFDYELDIETKITLTLRKK